MTPTTDLDGKDLGRGPFVLTGGVGTAGPVATVPELLATRFWASAEGGPVVRLSPDRLDAFVDQHPRALLLVLDWHGWWEPVCRVRRQSYPPQAGGSEGSDESRGPGMAAPLSVGLMPDRLTAAMVAGRVAPLDRLCSDAVRSVNSFAKLLASQPVPDGPVKLNATMNRAEAAVADLCGRACESYERLPGVLNHLGQALRSRSDADPAAEHAALWALYRGLDRVRRDWLTWPGYTHADTGPDELLPPAMAGDLLGCHLAAHAAAVARASPLAPAIRPVADPGRMAELGTKAHSSLARDWKKVAGRPGWGEFAKFFATDPGGIPRVGPDGLVVIDRGGLLRWVNDRLAGVVDQDRRPPPTPDRFEDVPAAVESWGWYDPQLARLRRLLRAAGLVRFATAARPADPEALAAACEVTLGDYRALGVRAFRPPAGRTLLSVRIADLGLWLLYRLARTRRYRGRADFWDYPLLAGGDPPITPGVYERLAGRLGPKADPRALEALIETLPAAMPAAAVRCRLRKGWGIDLSESGQHDFRTRPAEGFAGFFGAYLGDRRVQQAARLLGLDPAGFRDRLFDATPAADSARQGQAGGGPGRAFETAGDSLMADLAPGGGGRGPVIRQFEDALGAASVFGRPVAEALGRVFHTWGCSIGGRPTAPVPPAATRRAEYELSRQDVRLAVGYALRAGGFGVAASGPDEFLLTAGPDGRAEAARARALAEAALDGLFAIQATDVRPDLQDFDPGARDLGGPDRPLSPVVRVEPVDAW